MHTATPSPDGQLVRIDCSLSDEENFREGLLGQSGAGGTWIKQAKGGTLFLHHIQCLPLPMQKELVSVLRATSAGFRLVCTTTEDLEKLTDEGTFHDELFYRVASLPVVIPSLHDRSDDIPALVKHFASKTTNPNFDASQVEFTEDAIEVLQAYHWPGNLTELNQVVSKLASTAESRVITSQELPMRLKEVKDWPKLEDSRGTTEAVRRSRTSCLQRRQRQSRQGPWHSCRANQVAGRSTNPGSPLRICYLSRVRQNAAFYWASRRFYGVGPPADAPVPQKIFLMVHR
ncbi:MAG: sigma 54-interacting transcriptional regulator [Nibricoccus sp.]